MNKLVIISLLYTQSAFVMGMDKLATAVAVTNTKKSAEQTPQKTRSIPMTRSAEIRREEKEAEELRTIERENRQREQLQQSGKPFAYSPCAYLAFMENQSCSPSPSDYRRT